MPWKTDEHVYTWKDLEGKVSPEVLCAPRTGGDPTGEWTKVHARIIRYLVRHVVGKPWADYLTLVAAVFTAQRRDVMTVETALKTLHPRFTLLFPLLKLNTVSQWSIDQHLMPYMRGNILPQDSLTTRVSFCKRYMSTTKLVTGWLDLLPAAQQKIYQPFLFPPVNPFLVEALYKLEQEVTQQQQEHRKEETEAVVPQFTALRAEAHFRYNRIHRLWQAYHQAVAQVLPDHSNLPLEFSYEEGEPPVERIHCRLWDRRSFVLHAEHRHQYHHSTITNAQRKRYSFSDEHNEIFLEVLETQGLERDVPPERFWFLDILWQGLLKRHINYGTEQEVAERQAWLRKWGYGEDGSTMNISPFETNHPGLLAWASSMADGRGGGWGSALVRAQRRTKGTVIPLESLYAAATFGLVALELLTTTGIHVTWNMPPSPLTIPPSMTFSGPFAPR